MVSLIGVEEWLCFSDGFSSVSDIQAVEEFIEHLAVRSNSSSLRWAKCVKCKYVYIQYINTIRKGEAMIEKTT